MKPKSREETDAEKAKRYEEVRAFEERQRLVHVQTFLERLAFRARRSDDLATAEECSRLMSIAEHKPLPATDLEWVRTWWAHLAALDADYFPGLYRNARARRLPSPLWRFGSALSMTETEFKAHAERVGVFVAERQAAQGRDGSGVTVSTLTSDIGRIEP